MKNLAFSLLLLCSYTTFSQTGANFEQEVLQSDSIFWNAYNNCDVETMNKFIADDVEFYHDRGGVEKGFQELSTTIKNNLCSNKDLRLRREAVPGSIKVYPMKANGNIYGAVMYGEHLFYVLETGKEPKLDGLAKFTHLWILKDGSWKMSRILSYDHGPAVRPKTDK